MDKALLLALFIFSSCGKNVSISTKELESNSRLSDGSTLATNQEGTLKRGTPDLIIQGGTSSKVSIYSSYQSLEFIAIRPLNGQFNVKFRGKLKNNEMVLEVIELK